MRLLAPVPQRHTRGRRPQQRKKEDALWHVPLPTGIEVHFPRDLGSLGLRSPRGKLCKAQ